MDTPDPNGHYFPRAKSLQWFKSNLGACIIKGKILAIPIIELNENNGKETNT